MLLHLKIHKKSSFDLNQLKTSTQHKYNIKNVIKMENSLLFIFDEIWPKDPVLYTGSLARFWSNLKNNS